MGYFLLSISKRVVFFISYNHLKITPIKNPLIVNAHYTNKIKTICPNYHYFCKINELIPIVITSFSNIVGVTWYYSKKSLRAS
jgi:hypothetical protein